MAIQIVYRTDVDFQSPGKLYLTKRTDKSFIAIYCFFPGSLMRSHRSTGDNADAEPLQIKDRFIIREKPVGSETQLKKKTNLC